MKKLYTLSALLIAGASFAQTPIITGMLDGDCSGGTPKAIEIYADGTVDFSQYSLENQTNANTTWGNTLSLAALGSVTDDYVYIVNYDASNNFSTEFASVPTSNILVTETGGSEIPQPLNINGDDRLRIINTSTSAVIDQYGQEGTDGTGLFWEHTDSWAYRVDGTGPDGSNFTQANWTFGGVAALDGLGSCQGGEPFSTVVPFGTYSATTSLSTEEIAGLKVFPNPLAAGSQLNITSNNGIEKAVAIFDVLGKQVFAGNTNRGAVNTTDLKAGIYIVKITEGSATATRKLIVQ